MKRIFSLLLVVLLLVSTVPTAFATNDYTAGTTVTYTADDEANENWTITVPAKLTPGGNGTVTLQGTWPSNKTITVTAEKTVTLTNSINANDTKTLAIDFKNGISAAGSDTEQQKFTETVSVEAITNALFGTWDGAFYYYVETKDTPELITFKIDGKSYQAEENMTWEQWVSTDYNTATAIVSDGKITISDDHVFKDYVTSEEYLVNSTDKIANNGVYWLAAFPLECFNCGNILTEEEINNYGGLCYDCMFPSLSITIYTSGVDFYSTTVSIQRGTTLSQLDGQQFSLGGVDYTIYGDNDYLYLGYSGWTPRSLARRSDNQYLPYESISSTETVQEDSDLVFYVVDVCSCGTPWEINGAINPCTACYVPFFTFTVKTMDEEYITTYSKSQHEIWYEYIYQLFPECNYPLYCEIDDNNYVYTTYEGTEYYISYINSTDTSYFLRSTDTHYGYTGSSDVFIDFYLIPKT